MTRSDWLSVFFKVLGMYAVINGVAELIATLLLMDAVAGPVRGPFIGRLLSTAIWITAGWFLVKRTSSCLQWCGEPKIPN